MKDEGGRMKDENWFREKWMIPMTKGMLIIAFASLFCGDSFILHPSSFSLSCPCV